MSEPEYWTYFEDMNGGSLGDTPGVLPVTLFKGMKITIHGHPGIFLVESWPSHNAEEAGRPH